MNPLDQHRNTSTRIALSDVQKQALAAALREARKEGRRYRPNPENFFEGITAAKSVSESRPVSSQNFIL